MVKPNSEGFAEVDAAKPATAKQIAAVIKAAQDQKRAENKVARLEKDLKSAKAELQLLTVNTVPKVMGDASLTVCPLGKGWSVEIDTITSASIPSADSKLADNAEERNHAGIAAARKACPDLIQNQIVINFGIKDERWYATELARLRRRKKTLDFLTRSTIHSGRLSAWVRRQDEAGASVDEAAFNVHRKRISKLIPPKVKGGKDAV